MINIPQRIESKKAAYLRLPKFVRGLIVVASFAVGLVGAVLSFAPPPLFDIGIILLLLSLSILSLQFKWAHAVLLYITSRLADRSFRKKLMIIISIVFAIFIGGISIYWFQFK